jgi:hypothetical protein
MPRRANVVCECVCERAFECRRPLDRFEIKHKTGRARICARAPERAFPGRTSSSAAPGSRPRTLLRAGHASPCSMARAGERGLRRLGLRERGLRRHTLSSAHAAAAVHTAPKAKAMGGLDRCRHRGDGERSRAHCLVRDRPHPPLTSHPADHRAAQPRTQPWLKLSAFGLGDLGASVPVNDLFRYALLVIAIVPVLDMLLHELGLRRRLRSQI